MSINKELKVFGKKGYCCPMDSGPMSSYLKKSKASKRVRKLLKRLTRKEVMENS